MSDAGIPVWLQALGVVGVLAFVVGIVAWLMWLMREAALEGISMLRVEG